MKKLLLTIITAIAVCLMGYAQPHNGLAFDGIDDHIGVEHSASLNFGANSNITIECWFKTSRTGTYQSFVNKRVSYPSVLGGYAAAIESSGKISLMKVGTQGYSAYVQTVDSNYADGTWHHFAGILAGTNANNFNIYIDGVAQSLTIVSNNYLGNMATTLDLNIGGGDAPADFFEGVLDEVRIWDRVRTVSEINYYKNTYYCPVDAGLVLNYRFTQGVSGGNNLSLYNVTDNSSYLNNGLLWNFDLSSGNTTSNWVSGAFAHPSVQAYFSSFTDILCPGDSTGTLKLAVSGGIGSYTYEWTPSVSISDTAYGLPAGSYSVVVKDQYGCSHPQAPSATITGPLSFNVSGAAYDEINGADGSIDYTVSYGGTAPYNYVWQPDSSTNQDLSGLTVGSYSLTITDANGCIKKDTLTVRSAFWDAPACIDSVVSYTPTPGGFVYAGNGNTIFSTIQTFTNPDSITNFNVMLQLGTCKANGLSTAQLDILPVYNGIPDVSTVIASVTIPADSVYGSPSCIDGDVHAAIFKFRNVYLHADSVYALSLKNEMYTGIWWQQGADNYAGGSYWKETWLGLTEYNNYDLQFYIYALEGSVDTQAVCGNYTYNGNTYDSSAVYTSVLPTLNGCDSIVTTYFIVNPIPTVNDTLTVCGSYTYNGNTYDSSAVYTDTVSAIIGCDTIVTKYFIVNPLPTVHITGLDTIYNGQTDTLIASGATSYWWSTGDQTDTLIVNSVVDTIIMLTGTIDSTGCYSTDTMSIIVLTTTGIIDDVAENTSILAYPNPVANTLHVMVADNTQASSINVKIYNTLGAMLQSSDIENHNGRIAVEVSSLPVGVYTLQIGSATVKFVKQ